MWESKKSVTITSNVFSESTLVVIHSFQIYSDKTKARSWRRLEREEFWYLELEQ